ncbi:MAG: 4Fe-4S dicluster domain-containing protein [Bacteroidetes bacterium]|nr:4Fe-4S dicluster domain-containing protein [Bacteroidota bacterium]
MSRIDPGFASELKKYGARDFSACFNCGNCTAVCGLTEKDANFPRMLIRQGMLGQKEEILASRELWLCYACGDCSETCPRQAGPGDYMAALRRYAISSYEPTGLTKLIFKSNPLFILFTLLLSVLLGFFLFTLKPDHEVARWLFTILPYDVIHNMGLVIFSITGISVIWGLATMTLRLTRNKVKTEGSKNNIWKALTEVVNEMATMNRYKTCDIEEDSYWKEKPAAVQPWFVHWSIMWGFIGLLVATVLDFMLKDPATAIWWPSRILGTIAGLFLVYGTSLAINYRMKKVTKAYSETRLADWMFLWFLWIAGITGFWLEVSVTFSFDHLLNHLVLLVHTIISMELVLLFAFSKFAHAFYRPLALFFYFKNGQGNK